MRLERSRLLLKDRTAPMQRHDGYNVLSRTRRCEFLRRRKSLARRTQANSNEHPGRVRITHFFLPAASLVSRSALSRSVLARSASRSALYSAIALAPSVARASFFNTASANFFSLVSSFNVQLLASARGLDRGHRTRFPLARLRDSLDSICAPTRRWVAPARKTHGWTPLSLHGAFYIEETNRYPPPRLCPDWPRRATVTHAELRALDTNRPEFARLLAAMLRARVASIQRL
jgi:hypothetical protein